MTDEKTKDTFWCTPRKVLFIWARLITLVFRTFRPLLFGASCLPNCLLADRTQDSRMGGGDPGSHVTRLIDICLFAAAATRDRAQHGEWHNKGPFRFIFNSDADIPAPHLPLLIKTQTHPSTFFSKP